MRNLPPQENPLNGDVPPELQIYSTGFLCMMLQQPPHVIDNLARLAGVEPSMYVNGVPHFRGDDVQKMAAFLADRRAAAEAAANN